MLHVILLAAILVCSKADLQCLLQSQVRAKTDKVNSSDDLSPPPCGPKKHSQVPANKDKVLRSGDPTNSPCGPKKHVGCRSCDDVEFTYLPKYEHPSYSYNVTRCVALWNQGSDYVDDASNAAADWGNSILQGILWGASALSAFVPGSEVAGVIAGALAGFIGSWIPALFPDGSTATACFDDECTWGRVKKYVEAYVDFKVGQENLRQIAEQMEGFRERTLQVLSSFLRNCPDCIDVYLNNTNCFQFAVKPGFESYENIHKLAGKYIKTSNKICGQPIWLKKELARVLAWDNTQWVVGTEQILTASCGEFGHFIVSDASTPDTSGGDWLMYTASTCQDPHAVKASNEAIAQSNCSCGAQPLKEARSSLASIAGAMQNEKVVLFDALSNNDTMIPVSTFYPNFAAMHLGVDVLVYLLSDKEVGRGSYDTFKTNQKSYSEYADFAYQKIPATRAGFVTDVPADDNTFVDSKKESIKLGKFYTNHDPGGPFVLWKDTFDTCSSDILELAGWKEETMAGFVVKDRYYSCSKMFDPIHKNRSKYVGDLTAWVQGVLNTSLLQPASTFDQWMIHVPTPDARFTWNTTSLP